MLGMGAMRAGTTWLWDYLRTSPHFVVGVSKECHVLDLDLPSENWQRERLIIKARGALDAVAEGTAGPDASRLLLRASMAADPRRYIDHFAGVLARPGRAYVTGDLTPSHALLPAARLNWVRESFEARGVRTVPLMVLRDPVDRIWSQVRLRRQRASSEDPVSAASQLLADHQLPVYSLRTRYDHTLAALDTAFPGGESQVMFYETMFSREAMRAVSAAVGLPPRPPAVDARRNATERESSPLDPDVQATVAQHFAEVYHCVADRFPEVDLTTIWPSAVHVL